MIVEARTVEPYTYIGYSVTEESAGKFCNAGISRGYNDYEWVCRREENHDGIHEAHHQDGQAKARWYTGV